MSGTADIIQQRVYDGYRIAASVVGQPHDLYRPSGPDDPIRLLNLIGSVPAIFDARPSLRFSIPALHMDFARYAIVDGNQIQVGDYLVGRETIFVAAMPPLQSIVCIACNAVVSLRHQDKAPGFGAIADRSPEVAEEQVVFRNWPVSALYAGRGGGDDVQLPGDAPPANFNIIMPRVPDVRQPRSGDVLAFRDGRRMAVGWLEETGLGWRMVGRDLVGE